MQEMLLKVWCEATSRLFEVRSGERGATAVEYGIMVALIAAVIIVTVKSIGSKTHEGFKTVDTNLP